MLSFIVEHKYLAIFVGTLFGGELVLVPTIYFISKDVFTILIVMGIAIGGTLLSDSFYYLLGRHLTREKLFSLPFLKKRREMMSEFSRFFNTKSFFIIAFSKFIYGMRMPVQILAGMHRVYYWKYMIASILGIISWILFLMLIVTFIDVSLIAFKDTTYFIQISFLILIALLVVFHWVLKRYMRKKFLK